MAPGPRSVAELEILEAFGDRKTLAGGHLGSPFADRLLQLGPVADLALVFAEGLDLEVDRVADVHPGFRIVRAGEVDLLDLMRFWTFVEQLGTYQPRILAWNYC